MGYAVCNDLGEREMVSEHCIDRRITILHNRESNDIPPLRCGSVKEAVQSRPAF